MVSETEQARWADPEEGSELFSRRTAQAMVAGRLRVEILSGALPPGTRLLQAKLAERMRTSTTPVRAAMAELAAEGLADVDPHRGVIVHEPTEAELREIYEMRYLLDPILIEKTVGNITESEMARADSLCEKMEGVTEGGHWVVLNSQFHAVLDEAARSPLLASTVRNLRNRSSIYIAASLRESPERIAAANGEHRNMVAACHARDVARALEPTHRHIEATVELVTNYPRRTESKTA